ATNANGDGPAATTSPVTPVTLPSAVINPLATAGNAQATVKWAAPASTGGSPITGYTVTSSPGSFTCTTTGALTCTVNGLTNGTRYSFAVVATSGVGDGPAGTSNQVTPMTVPTAPLSPSATAGNSQSTVSWTTPTSDGGSAITGYVVIASPGGAICATTGALTCVVAGLNNGTSYTFSISATNSVGAGPAATTSPVTPATKPSAVISPRAAAGNAKATVTWIAPASTGGSPITGYTVTSSPGGSTCTTTGALTCTVNGLTNGTTYSFTVVATNGTGDGPAGTSNQVTPSTVPTAPLTPSATAGNAKATVSWTTPSSDGGSPITGYTVTSSPGSFTCTTTGALTCTVNGLTNGTAYTFSIVATNANGDGPAATTSPVTPATLPSAVINPTAVAGNAQATVRWTAPASTGGSPITGYTVTSSPGSFTCTTTGDLTCTVNGLTNGTEYSFTVTATTTVGTGPAGHSNPVTPATVPTAPLEVEAIPSSGHVLVAWQAPGSDGGSPITGYTVTATPGGATCTTTGAYSCTIGGLVNGTTYTFSFTATNEVGTGLAADTTPSATPADVPSMPLSPTVVPQTTSATVSWSTPATDGGSPITGYTVFASGTSQSCTYVVGSGSPENTCTVTGLTADESYTFTIVANNAVGASPQASATAVVGIFACTSGTFLESRLGNIQSTSDFTSWTTVGSETGFVNAIGYRPTDGFVYGVGAPGAALTGPENHLFRIAGNGALKDLGRVHGLPRRDAGLKFPAGDFDPATDRLIVAKGTLIYSIDVTTLQATQVVFPSGAQPVGWDLVAQGDWLWTVTPNALEGINMTTHAVVTTALPGGYAHSGYGAMWSSTDGQSVYFESNATGNVYRATGLGGQVTFSQVGHLGAAPNMDGATCLSEG
ncbi:MAG: fibronectin type III domain-containing protein, partial [Actinomycetes bacterium]